MSRRKSISPPKYRLHKARDLAVVTINGKDHYLGKYGSAQSHETYAHLLAKWRQGLCPDAAEEPKTPVTIAELTLAYWEYCRVYYSRDGKPNGRTAVVRCAMQAVNGSYADLEVSNFGPLKLQVVRQKLIDRKLSRRYINDLVFTTVAMFKWAVSQEIIAGSVLTELKSVTGLRKGKTLALDAPPVQPADELVVQKTLEHASPVIRAMLELQLLTGARPGEIRNIRPRYVTMESNGVWCYRPAHHKSEIHGKDRRIYMGPKAQAILRPYLNRDPDTYCFSPQEAEEARRREQHRKRKTPVQPSQRTRRTRNAKRRPGEKYTKDSFRRAAIRACEKAGVAVFTPHQLRHTRATALRKRYDLATAQVILGHSDPKVTEMYAERDYERAASIMREIG